MQESLRKYITRARFISKDEALDLIESKIVKVDGNVITDFNYLVNDSSVITINDQVLEIKEEKVEAPVVETPVEPEAPVVETPEVEADAPAEEAPATEAAE